jgi:hypothetical protein
MKVRCINHNVFDEGDIPYGPNDPQVGESCEVVSECVGTNDIGIETPCFELVGYPEWVYDQRNFAQVSNLDETELVTEEFEEKYCVPVNGKVCK